jgi:hypothetical protein
MKHLTLIALTLSCAASAALAQPKPPIPGQNAAKAAAPAVKTVLPAATGKLTPIGDGATVLSADGKLIWMRCQIGQNFEKGQCLGDPKKMDQRDAANEVKRINFTGGYAGSQDWRLPSIEELHTLVFCEHGMNGRERSIKLNPSLNKNLADGCQGDTYLRPTIDPIVFPNASKDWVWTSTPDLDRVVNMWAINFASGSPAPIGRANNQTGARAVRSAP